MNKNNRLVKLEDHIDKQFGVRGTPEREEFEMGYEAFRIGVLLQEMRKGKNMSQQELADLCGTTKSNISKIENHSADIKLSTLMRVALQGLGMHLTFSLNP